MTDKVQLIKEEIERLYNLYELANDYQRMGACSTILDFIDSLPEEPIVKGITWEDVNTLESLIYQVHNEYPSIGEKSFGLEVLEKFQGCQDAIEYPASEDLEEAASLYCHNLKNTGNGLYGYHITDAFKAGAEWQKQQMKEALQTEYEKGRFDMREEMMKDAVETVMQYDECDDLVPTLTDMSKRGFKKSEKVYVIIIKEDNQ